MSLTGRRTGALSARRRGTRDADRVVQIREHHEPTWRPPPANTWRARRGVRSARSESPMTKKIGEIGGRMSPAGPTRPTRPPDTPDRPDRPDRPNPTGPTGPTGASGGQVAVKSRSSRGRVAAESRRSRGQVAAARPADPRSLHDGTQPTPRAIRGVFDRSRRCNRCVGRRVRVGERVDALEVVALAGGDERQPPNEWRVRRSQRSGDAPRESVPNTTTKTRERVALARRLTVAVHVQHAACRGGVWYGRRR